jgi:hypothetical protein
VGSDTIDDSLRRLLSALQDANEGQFLDLVTSVLAADQSTRNRFLVSNELCGGAGSIADQAGVGPDTGRQKRRQVEQALIHLGEEQARIGVLNSRTLSWVETFKHWHRDNI